MADVDRRRFLIGTVGSLGLAAAVRGAHLSAFAQAAAPARRNRIDIHHHFAPPAWVAEVKGRPLLQPANTRWTPAQSIEYAYETLEADGIGLFTSYGDTWLGNAAFRPVMEELNRRRAVVHVHPTAADCCRNLDYGVAPGSIEYGTDTTRAIIGVTFSGDAARFPDIRFIWSHAGGSAPFLAGRIEGASGTAKDRMPNGFIAEVKKFFYDTAGAANRGAMASLLELVPSRQILFGTDFPPGGTSRQVAQLLAGLRMFDASAMRAIDVENAVRLLPRLEASVS